MIDPDGKKSKISIVDLRNLINQLPEESEMVMEIRAMSARSSGKIEEAAPSALSGVEGEGYSCRIAS